MLVLPVPPFCRPEIPPACALVGLGFLPMTRLFNSFLCLGVLVVGIVLGWAIGGIAIMLVLR